MKPFLIASLSLVLMALGAMGAESLDLAGEWRLRLVVKSEMSGQPFAAIAELDILSAN